MTEFWLLPKVFLGELKVSIFRDWLSRILDPIHVWAKMAFRYHLRIITKNKIMGVIFYLKLVHLRFRNYSILFYLYSDSTVSKKSDYSPILPFKMTSTKNVRVLFGSLMAREVKIFIFAYLAIKLPSNAHIVYRNIMIRLKKKYSFN